MRTILRHHSARSRIHVVFRCRHSSSVVSCLNSRPDLVSLGSVEHIRVGDPLSRWFLGLVSSREHCGLHCSCGLVVGSSDFSDSSPRLHHCSNHKTHRLRQNPTFTSGRRTYSSHCVLILIASPRTSIAFHPVAESNRAWVNGKGIV